MNIYSAIQIKEWERCTLVEQDLTAIELMERAASVCFSWFSTNELTGNHIHLVCGKGNNGGDGLALARMLIHAGTKVSVYIIETGKPGTPEFQENLRRFHLLSNNITFLQDEHSLIELEKDAIVVDAMYGTGLNRPLNNLAEKLVLSLNSLPITVISIDMPSGLFSDSSSKGCTVLSATHTLSFQNFKAAFLFPENSRHIGQLHLLDLQLSESFDNSHVTAWELTDREIIGSIVRQRHAFSHKGDYGHAVLACGSYGMMGAAILAAKGCLSTGAGKLTCIIPGSGYDIIQISVPEAMSVTAGDRFIDEIEPGFHFSAIGIGPGISQSQQVQSALIRFLKDNDRSVVFDADALNCLATLHTGQSMIPAGSVITPHPKEFERLFGATENNFSQLALAIASAAKYNIYIVLKGHHTAVVTPKGKVFFNSTGNSGMAKAGMGDVLTGMITGLIAQGYLLPEAAILGVYIHGLAGDLAANTHGKEAMQATDLIAYVGEAWKQLHKSAGPQPH